MESHSIIFRELDAAYRRKRLVTVYPNRNDAGDYVIGFVDIMTDMHLRLRCINRYGERDGYRVRNLGSIFRVDWDSDFEKTIELMHSRLPCEIFDRVELPQLVRMNDLRYSTLLDAKEKRLVVSVDSGFDEKPLSGFVEEIDSSHLRLLYLDVIGNEDGFVTIATDLLHNIDCDTQYESRLKILHQEYRKGKTVRVVE